MKIHRTKLEKFAVEHFQKAEELQVLSKKLGEIYFANQNEEESLRKTLQHYFQEVS